MKLFNLIWLTLLPSIVLGQPQANLVKSGAIVVDGNEYIDLEKAEQAIRENSQVYIGKGVYNDGFTIRHSNVIISGEAGVHFISAVVNGKATFVVQGNNVTIENIECSQVKVFSKNGSCIRQEGKDLTVSNVYFHDSEQGILSNKNTGFLKVKFSKFENLGKEGKAHAIYSLNDYLSVSYSTVINSKNQGHEIKSRAKETIIEYSVIGSFSSNDSRAIDISEGGNLAINNSIILKSESSINGQLIGFGLEKVKRQRKNTIEIIDSLFYLNRPNSNTLLKLGNILLEKRQIHNNVIIGRKITDISQFTDSNYHLVSLKESGFQLIELLDISVISKVRLSASH